MCCGKIFQVWSLGKSSRGKYPYVCRYLKVFLNDSAGLVQRSVDAKNQNPFIPFDRTLNTENSSASEVTTLLRYTNLFIIIITIILTDKLTDDILSSYSKKVFCVCLSVCHKSLFYQTGRTD